MRYIHLISHRCFHADNCKSIKSFWSSSRCPPKRFGQTVDHSVLTGLPRLASPIRNCDCTSVRFGLLNFHSLTNKEHLIQDILTHRKLDFLCLTETWLKPKDYSKFNESTPPGFVYISQPRDSLCKRSHDSSQREVENPASVCSCLQLL